MVIEQKCCGRCKEAKPATEFCKNSKRGLQHYCRPCSNIIGKEHRLKHPEKYATKAAKYREKNRDLLMEKCGVWRKNNKAKQLKAVTSWQKRNPEKVKEYAKKASVKRWARSRVKEVFYKWRKEHPESVKKARDKWKRLNPGKIKAAQHRRRIRKLYNVPMFPDADMAIQRIRQSKKLKCFYCGTEITGVTCHIDHVVALAKNGIHGASNLVPSCRSCNSKKSSKDVNQFISIGQLVLL